MLPYIYIYILYIIEGVVEAHKDGINHELCFFHLLYTMSKYSAPRTSSKFLPVE